MSKRKKSKGQESFSSRLGELEKMVEAIAKEALDVMNSLSVLEEMVKAEERRQKAKEGKT